MEFKELIKVMVECSICETIYKDPRILPCGHTFCSNCLRKEVDDVFEQGSFNDNNTMIKLACKTCDAPWEVDGGGSMVDELPKNLTVGNVASVLELQNSHLQQQSNEKRCNIHRDRYIIDYCKSCSEVNSFV